MIGTILTQRKSQSEAILWRTVPGTVRVGCPLARANVAARNGVKSLIKGGGRLVRAFGRFVPRGGFWKRRVLGTFSIYERRFSFIISLLIFYRFLTNLTTIKTAKITTPIKR